MFLLFKTANTYPFLQVQYNFPVSFAIIGASECINNRIDCCTAVQQISTNIKQFGHFTRNDKFNDYKWYVTHKETSNLDQKKFDNPAFGFKVIQRIYVFSTNGFTEIQLFDDSKITECDDTSSQHSEENYKQTICFFIQNVYALLSVIFRVNYRRRI